MSIGSTSFLINVSKNTVFETKIGVKGIHHRAIAEFFGLLIVEKDQVRGHLERRARACYQHLDPERNLHGFFAQ
jgi:hypothetical protein